MQRVFLRASAIVLVLSSLAFFSQLARAQSATADRITQAINGSKVSMVAGTVHPLAKTENEQGLVDSSLQLQGMSLDFGRTAAQQTALEALLKAQQDPSSPSYHQWLTTEEFADRFGMTQSDIDKAAAWLTSQGFTIDHVDESRTAIRFSGTAALAQAAFHTQIHKYLVNGQTHFANATAISVPSALASSVIRVSGLNDFKLKPSLVRPAGSKTSHSAGALSTVSPQFTTGTGGEHLGTHFLAPGDFAVIYDLNPLISSGFSGTGQYIGVIGQTNIVMADITAFRTNAQLPVNNPTVFVVPNTTPGNDYNSEDINEADLDLEWSGGVAPSANIIFVNSNNVFVSLQYAIANKINGIQLPVLTMSYGGCEAAQSHAAILSLEQSLSQAAAQGQTVIVSSGDSGAAGCDDTGETITSATLGLAVNYPASSVYVTGLGGSSFMGDGTAANPSYGTDQYWSSNGSNDVLTSAQSYIPEMGWNDTAFELTLPGGGNGLSAGGGGVSALFAKPTWQTSLTPKDGFRDVPDVSLNASPEHDGYLVCTQVILDSDNNPNPTNADYTSSCASGFRISDPGFQDDQTVTVFGGTSAAAPSFAGILSLIEQKLGNPQGLINPTLYTLASNSTTYASAFHDITTGNNIVPCTAGTPGGAPASTICPSSGQFGYSAGVGYDQATGLGSVDGNNLATAFSSVATKTGSTTAVTVSANPTAEAIVTFTATVTANTGTTVPTGTVTFTLSNGTTLGPITLANGTATATTTFAAGGAYSVTAAYSGDTNFYASTSSATTFTIAAGAEPTATSVSLNPNSVAIGGSFTINATITTATGALAGTVNFFVGNSSTPLSCSPVAVTPGATGMATASCTVPSVATSAGFSAGANTITATYGGTANFASSSGTATLTVTNPGITVSVANMTISSPSPGHTGTSTITLTSTGGYSGTVNLTATAATLNASYTISPPTVALTSGATGTSAITLTTVSADLSKRVGSNLQKRAANMRVAAGAAAALGAVFFLGIPGFRKRRWPTLIALLLLGAMSAGLGCGGGSGGGGGNGSPTGTYTVTVTATDSANTAITSSANFTVTIQ